MDLFVNGKNYSCKLRIKWSTHWRPFNKLERCVVILITLLVLYINMFIYELLIIDIIIKQNPHLKPVHIL